MRVAAFSPDGSYLATATEDNTNTQVKNHSTQIWEVSSGRQVARVILHFAVGLRFGIFAFAAFVGWPLILTKTYR